MGSVSKLKEYPIKSFPHGRNLRGTQTEKIKRERNIKEEKLEYHQINKKGREGMKGRKETYLKYSKDITHSV